MSSQRKFPRVPIDQQARVILRRAAAAPQECRLINVSAEGVALRIPNKKFAALRGDTLTVSIITGSKWIDIPGRVVYARDTSSGEVVAGVKLHLEISGSATRQAWARWVYRLLSAARPPVHAGTAG